VRVPADSLSQLRKRRSAKWRTFDKDVLPLPVAEMDYPIAKPIQDVLFDMIKRSDVGYAGIIPELPKAFAKFAKRKWKWEVDTDQFRLATDVGVAGVEVIRLFTNPGDKVIINSPVYHNFYNWIKETNCQVSDVPLLKLGEDYVLDTAGLENAFAAGAKIYLMCHPHNPVGHVFSRVELTEIAKLAKQYGVLVISDEIHAPLTFKEASFIPYLSLNDQARETGICITSASKTWNLAGLKCAQIITQNFDLNEKLKELPFNVPWRTSILGTWASQTAYEEGEKWLASVIKNLDSNRKYLAKLLSKHLPKAKYDVPASTYLAWIDFTDYQVESPAKLFLEKGRVAVNDGKDFGPDSEKFIRLNLATSKRILRKAIKRMAKALAD
jgi:cystathionine beta-lyase